MVKTFIHPFDVNEYFPRGGVYKQRGRGLPNYNPMRGHGLPYYNPQRGHGNQIGHGLFSSIAKSFMPLFKNTILPTTIKAAKASIPSAIKAGTELVGDLISGRNVKKSVKSRGVQALKAIAQTKPVKDTLNKILNLTETKTTSPSRKRKLPKQRSALSKKIRRQQIKRRKNAFGFY